MTGDINAKSTEWEARVTDRRGRRLAEFWNQLIVCNKERKPTFRNANEVSYINVTACGEDLVNKVGG